MGISRHDISDDKWIKIEHLLPGQRGQHGGVAPDNRLFINAILYVGKTGIPWRDFPEAYGQWGVVYHRYNRWCKKGRWQVIFDALQDPDLEWLLSYGPGVATGIRLTINSPEDAASQPLSLSRNGFYEVGTESLLMVANMPLLHLNHGRLLRRAGRLAEAVRPLRLADALGSKQNNWTEPSGELLRRTEAQVELDRKLPAILDGADRPTEPASLFALADLCQIRARYAASARAYAALFDADPKYANDLGSGHRYDAACAAARAARGDGIDAPRDPGPRADLRAKALAWLRADLKLRKQQAALSTRAERETAAFVLSHWLSDADLSGARSIFRLAALPLAEVKQWLAFWDEVRATRAEAIKPPPPPEVAPAPRLKD